MSLTFELSRLIIFISFQFHVTSLTCDHMAYFLVHSLAVASYFALSVLKIWAISGTKGSSGFGSVRRELIDKRTLEIVRAGDHYSLRISKQIEPFELILGW